MNMAEKFGKNFMEIILHPNEGSPYARNDRHPTIRSYCVNRYGSSHSVENDDWEDVVDFIYHSNFHFDKEGRDEVLDFTYANVINDLIGRIQKIDIHYNQSRKEEYTFRGTRVYFKDNYATWNRDGIKYSMNIPINSFLKLAMRNGFTFINNDSNGAIMYGSDLKEYIIEGEGSEVDKACREIYNAMREARIEFNERNTEEVVIQLLKDSGVVNKLARKVLY